jgi:hypothetical protein
MASRTCVCPAATGGRNAGGANRVHSITDKGAGKGAIAVVVRELYLQEGGEKVAESRNLTFLRGDGGFSATDGVSDSAPAPLPAVPEREADLDVSYATLPQGALIYRLSGDYNPLHADPDFSARAGFERPILHGLCTYGMAARAVIERVLGFDGHGRDASRGANRRSGSRRCASTGRERHRAAPARARGFAWRRGARQRRGRDRFVSDPLRATWPNGSRRPSASADVVALRGTHHPNRPDKRNTPPHTLAELQAALPEADDRTTCT